MVSRIICLFIHNRVVINRVARGRLSRTATQQRLKRRVLLTALHPRLCAHSLSQINNTKILKKKKKRFAHKRQWQSNLVEILSSLGFQCTLLVWFSSALMYLLRPFACSFTCIQCIHFRIPRSFLTCFPTLQVFLDAGSVENLLRLVTLN